MSQSPPSHPINLAEQFDRYYPLVFKYFRYRGMDSDTANDLAAMVFERALASINRFDSRKATFNTWIYTIARNIAINHWKTQARVKNVAIDFVNEKPGKDISPEESLIHAERVEKLLAALGGLPDRDREVVILKFAGCFSNRQIASLMGLSPNHVGIILYRALIKMKTELSLMEKQVRNV